MSKTCLIYNYAQHYRANIFSLMDKELNCDFVFGDRMSDVKKMDYELLTQFKKEVKNIFFLNTPVYFQTGVIPILWQGYSNFLVLGDVHCISTWLILFISKIKRRKVYLWTHGYYGKESIIKRKVKKVFFFLSTGVFLYGNYARDIMLKQGISSNKLYVIYNSLDYDTQILLRSKLNSDSLFFDHFGNNYPNLIFVGRLTQIKKIELLLDALYLLISESQHYNLTIVGDGEEKNKLLQIAKEYGLEEYVWFYGESYEEKELSKLIYNANLCVSPGNVGLTAIHAMTYGTPVLSHDNFPFQMPEFEAIIDGITGTYFKYNDPISLAKSINRWFDISIDRELIRRECFSVIDTKYNPHIQLETFIEVFRDK